MSKENFIAMRRVVNEPNDIKSAIAVLCEVVEKQSKPYLSFKMGAIQGAYEIYERTRDVAILEQIIVDIAIIFKNVLDPEKPVYEPMDYKGPFEDRTDVLFMKPAGVSVEKTITKEELINNCLNGEVSGYSQSTYYSYSAGLKKILKDAQIPEKITYTQLEELLNQLDKMKENPNYNHNIKSAISVLKKYIRNLLEK